MNDLLKNIYSQTELVTELSRDMKSILLSTCYGMEKEKPASIGRIYNANYWIAIITNRILKQYKINVRNPGVEEDEGWIKLIGVDKD